MCSRQVLLAFLLVILEYLQVHSSYITIASQTDELLDGFLCLVVQFYEAGQLTPDQVNQLHQELAALDLDLIESIFNKCNAAEQQQAQQQQQQQHANEIIEPLCECDQLEFCSDDQKHKWQHLGMQAIAKGEVCALVLGGGQGTRLGFAGPKGMYDIGLPSHKSLFQLFAERIRRLETLASRLFGLQARIPFYVMTSVMNHDETQQFFKQHHYFGLQPDQMFIFAQGRMPCLTFDGKLMLENAYTLAQASDGNGGLYQSLANSGALIQLQHQGVKYLHVFSVDNALCKVVEPIFMGYCIDKQADCANKVVWKDRWDEKVGVVARKNGQFCVVEYSELDQAMAKQTDPATGKLVFGAGNICNHFFTTDFLKNVVFKNLDLAYHVAKKKIPMADEQGKTFNPEQPTGIKLEAFIFDTFPLSSRMAVLSVPRDEEFAPVKNAPGEPQDSPDTARQMLLNQAKKWLWEAAQSPPQATKEQQLADKQAFKTWLDQLEYIEISPLVSYNGEDLAARVAQVFQDHQDQQIVQLD